MRRRLAPLVALAATVGFAALFARHVSWAETRGLLTGIPPATVLLSLAAVLAGMALTAVRWRTLLGAAGIASTVPRLFAGLAAGAAVNNVVPARGGDVVRVRSVPARASAVVGTLAAERLLDGFVLACFLAFGAALQGSETLLAAGGALAAGAGGGIAVAAWEPAWLARLPRPVRGFVSGLAVFRSPRRLAQALALSFALWGCDVVMYAALAPGFGLRLGLGGAFVLEGIGNLALAVPATAAGLGTFDYLTLVGTKSLGLGGAAGGYVLAVHAFVVLPATTLGLALLWWARPRRQLVLA